MFVRLVAVAAGIAVAAVAAKTAHASGSFSFAGSGSSGLLTLLGPGVLAVLVGAIGASGRLRRSGWLLWLAGITWLATEFDTPATTTPAVFTLGLILSFAYPAVVAHLILEKARNPVDRIVVAAGYLSTVAAFGLASALFFDPRSTGCQECTTNLVLVTDRADLAATFGRWGLRLTLVWISLAIGLIMWRAVRSGRAVTSALGIVLLGAAAWTVARSVDLPYLRGDETARTLWRLDALALVGIALSVGWAMRRSRVLHRRFTRLVVDLDRAGEGELVSEALRAMLGDPELAVAYPREPGRYVDAHGRPVDITADATRLVWRGRELAVVQHRPGLLDNKDVVDAVVAATKLGLENERLRALTRAQLADLRASRQRLLAAGDEERRRLERDLHDGAQQRLISALLALRLLRSQAGLSEIASVEREVDVALEALRELAHGVYPVALRDEGLASALLGLAESTPLLVHSVPQARFPEVVESTAYRLIAVAASTGETEARVVERADELHVEVRTRGHIVDLGDIPDRVAALTGRVHITSASGGTTISAQLPLPAVDRA